MDDQELVTVGRILRPRGIRGEVKVEPLTDSPDRFLQLGLVYVEVKDSVRRRLKLEGVKRQKRFLALKFEGVDCLADAEKLRDGFVLIDKSEVPPLPEGSFYVFDLIGIDVETEDGKKIGKVEDVINLPANDVYVVRGGGKEILIPATREVVLQVDLSANRMVVAPLEGLLD